MDGMGQEKGEESMSEPEIRLLQMDELERVERFFAQMAPDSRAFFNRNNINLKGIMHFFNGTDKRKPMPMCEVILTLNNEENLLNINATEVEIKRRAFRNGDNEYYLNR